MKKILEDNELLNSSNIKEYSENQVIANEGDIEVGWYVLLKGRVGVFKHDKKVAEFFEHGVVFGELSSILNTPRTATLIAIEPTRVIHFTATLDNIIEHYPKMTKQIVISLAERLAKTTDNLITVAEKGTELKSRY
ncbi:MAG: cyclic nucleotide-binding domain-containing protein [Bacteroidetes bacterium]|nr:cyclic nucleotide-binding domain-containing protein [Bacteroidota bacterium]